MRITITHVRLEYRKLLNVEASGLRFSALCLRKAEAVKISVARGAGEWENLGEKECWSFAVAVRDKKCMYV